ncbi:MAG: MMPL family transporter [Gordonibacter pamelaeae]
MQCGIYLVFSILALQGGGTYYLALLILQCILMGATIDYGILFTTYYREKRGMLGVKEALIAAYNGSIHTIATSGLIMILMTAVVGSLTPTPPCSRYA